LHRASCARQARFLYYCPFSVGRPWSRRHLFCPSQEDCPISAERQDRRNEEITVPRVRVIAADGTQIGIMLTRDAIARAEAEGLDLVEVSPNAEPPVCKIMDYGKFVYQRDKAQQAARKKQRQIQVKEIKFRPTTEEADYQTKLRALMRFLEEGDKIKVTLRYKGRELAHQELGFQLIDRIKSDLEGLAQIEQAPKLEGRQAVMVMAPKKR
jgi:translation initiation factor IF-3